MDKEYICLTELVSIAEDFYVSCQVTEFELLRKLRAQHDSFTYKPGIWCRDHQYGSTETGDTDNLKSGTNHVAGALFVGTRSKKQFVSIQQHEIRIARHDITQIQHYITMQIHRQNRKKRQNHSLENSMDPTGLLARLQRGQSDIIFEIQLGLWILGGLKIEQEVLLDGTDRIAGDVGVVTRV